METLTHPFRNATIWQHLLDLKTSNHMCRYIYPIWVHQKEFMQMLLAEIFIKTKHWNKSKYPRKEVHSGKVIP